MQDIYFFCVAVYIAKYSLFFVSLKILFIENFLRILQRKHDANKHKEYECYRKYIDDEKNVVKCYKEIEIDCQS